MFQEMTDQCCVVFDFFSHISDKQIILPFTFINIFLDLFYTNQTIYKY